MVTTFREKTKSPWFRGALLIIMFSMTVGGSLFVPGLLQQLRETSKALMTINGLPVSQGQFALKTQQEYERIELFRQQFGPQAEMILRMLGMQDPAETAYEALIQETLLDCAVNTAHLPVNEKYIVQQLNNPSFVMHELISVIPLHVLDRNGSINKMALDSYLKKTQLSMADFDVLLEKALSRSTFVGLLKSAAYVSPSEVREKFMQQYGLKSYAVAAFPRERYEKKAQKLTPTVEELKSFFEQQNKEHKRYWKPESRSARVLEFAPEAFEITVTPADIEKYYNKVKEEQFVQTKKKVQLRRILITEDSVKEEYEKMAKANKDLEWGLLPSSIVRQKITQLREELLKNPALFEQYAKEHSQDKKTASKGGLMEWATKEELKPEVGTAAFRLKEQEISPVLEAGEGNYEIVQLVGSKPKEYKPLASVKSQIEATLKAKKFNTKFTAALRSKITGKPSEETIADIKKTYKAQEKEMNNVVAEQSRLSQELFKLKQGEAVAFVEGNKGFMVVAQAIEKAHVPAFETVQSAVKKDWYAHKAEELLHEDLKKAEAVGFEKLGKEFDVTVDALENVSLEDKNNSEVLTKKGYPVNEMYAMHIPGAVATFPSKTHVYLVKFKGTGAFNEELFAQKKSEITNNLYKDTQESLVRGFVASLRRNAKIKVNDTIKTVRNTTR